MTDIFIVEGVAREGKKKGRTLGYPTANVPCDTGIASGIYAGEVVWNGTAHPAALYKEEGKPVIEAHLMYFSGDLYGERLMLRAWKKVRDVKVFPKKEDLIAAIARDIEDIKKICSRE